MASLWNKIWQNILGAAPPTDLDLSVDRFTAEAAAAARTEPKWFPNAYHLLRSDGRTPLFDPAYKHFPRAYRHGNPQFQNAGDAERWYTIRRLILDDVTAIAVESKWSDHLVLRGSMLMAEWYGEAARTPGDVDWVVTPADLRIDDRRARKMFDDLTAAIRARSTFGWEDAKISGVATDDIWTYDRVPGRRITASWQVHDLPPGSVQLDFVFGETLPTEPILTPLHTVDGRVLEVRTVDKQLSLAWKLQWLESDMHPQGKDLYDAVLLAEDVTLKPALVEHALQAAYPHAAHRPAKLSPRNWETDWETFAAEYPWIEGDQQAWLERLANALERE